MLKKSLMISFVFFGSVSISNVALATDRRDLDNSEKEPQEEVYCIRDFYTGQLLCIVVPDNGPVWA